MEILPSCVKVRLSNQHREEEQALAFSLSPYVNTLTFM